MGSRVSISLVKACSAVEEPWAREILNTVRACLGPARSGLSIEEVFRRLDCFDSQDSGGTTCLTLLV